MKLTITCSMCELPFMELLGVTKVNNYGLACCAFCNPTGEWSIVDLDVEGSEEICQADLMDEEDEDADWWKRGK